MARVCTNLSVQQYPFLLLNSFAEGFSKASRPCFRPDIDFKKKKIFPLSFGGNKESVVTKSASGINSALGLTHSLEVRFSESERESYGSQRARVAGAHARREASLAGSSERASVRVVWK